MSAPGAPPRPRSGPAAGSAPGGLPPSSSLPRRTWHRVTRGCAAGFLRSCRPVAALAVAAALAVLLAAPAEAQSGVPGAPTGLMVTVGHKAVKVDWTAPADDGGSAIIQYEVAAGEIRQTGSTSTSFITETGRFSTINIIRVRAVNANGNGPWSADVAAETGPATVTITGPMVISEGKPDGEVPFTLTADRPVLSTSEPLNVSVLVSETNNMIWHLDKAAKTVSFAINAQTATLIARIVDDGTYESDSDVTATIQTNSGYTVGTPSSATVTVTDDDALPGPPTDLTPPSPTAISICPGPRRRNPGSSQILGYRLEVPDGDPQTFTPKQQPRISLKGATLLTTIPPAFVRSTPAGTVTGPTRS